MKKKRDNLLKIIKRITVMVFVVFWAMMFLGVCYRGVQRRYFYPLDYKRIVFESSDYYRLKRELVFSVINVESGFNAKVVSSAGAIGLMQITEQTAKYIADLQGVENYDLFDPKTNVWFGCFYLKYLLEKFKDEQTAICAYNAGEGNVIIWLNNPEYSKDKKRVEKIPFKETEEYVKKIVKSKEKYKKLYGNILDKHQNFE